MQGLQDQNTPSQQMGLKGLGCYGLGLGGKSYVSEEAWFPPHDG